MFKITPIGSCRIYGPLREYGVQLGFQLNASRVFGLMHSSAEAVQQMHAFTGEFSCEDALWPLIARGKEFAHFQAQVHKKSDLYIVELSSAKVIEIDDTVLQLNYLNTHFSDFFSDSKRAVAFTQHCMKDDPVEVETFLDEVWNSTPEQREDAEILRRINIYMSTEQTLYEDICKLQEGLTNVMIVTHVNAKNENSAPLLSREKYINQVIAAANRAGAMLYNPTDLMDIVGQQNAIEDHSTAFAHFIGKFNGDIFFDWLDNTLLPMIDAAIQDAPEENNQEFLVPIVGGMIENAPAEQLKKLAGFLGSLANKHPEIESFAQLQQRVSAAI